MPQPIATQLGQFLATGAGTPRAGQSGDHTFSASVVGSGSVGATVLIEVSNDLLAWSTLTTLVVTGTAAASAQASVTASHSYWRATVSALTGTSVTVTAATEQDAAQLTSLQKARLMAVLPGAESLVSGAGNITAADLATTTGTLGQTVRLSDGPDQGAILMWSTPQGASSPTWCWWLWPQAAY